MLNTRSFLYALMLFAVVISWYGCRKETPFTEPPEVGHFMGQRSGSYFIVTAGSSFKIPLGITTVSAADRTVKVSVTSPTGAVEGTHYTLNKTTFVIPAGKVIDSLVVSGNFALYTTGRKDTLIFTIQDADKGGINSFGENNRYTLLMRGPCFEGEIASSLQDLLGDYNTTRDTLTGAFTYGPYKTTIKSATITSATTANIVVANLYDEGWNDLTFTLDWTDINDRKLTLVTQNAGGNAGNTFGAAYNGMPYGIRPVAASAGGQVGTFSYCGQTLTIKAQIGIFGVGYASNLYTVKMSR